MIKKLLGLLIIGLFSIGKIVNAYDTITNCYNNGSSNFNCLELSSSEMFVYGNYTNSFEDIFNFKDFDGQQVFTQGGFGWGGNSGWKGISSFFWSDGDLYGIIDGTVNSFYPLLIKYNGGCVADSVINSDIGNTCGLYKSNYSYYTNSISEILEIFNLSVPSSYLFLPPNLSGVPNGVYGICAKYNDLDKSLCFYIMGNSFDSSTYSSLITEIERGKTSQLNGVQYYSNKFGLSPFSGSNGSGDGDQEIVGIELGSDESAINYFEKRYGRSESICYAGIDNVTTNWGTSVSFQEGTGLNLFQVFSGIYNISPDINKVYVRLNSRLINYEQWFGRSGDPLYLSNYNTGTNQVDLYYDNLTFPFSNNPVAVYFLASNIAVHSEYSTMGSEIVSYCNLKINNGTFEEIIDQAVKNNITKYTEQSNKNNGLNPDGTIINNYINFDIYTGDAWISSGVEIAFSGNTSVKNSLKNFFDNINSIYSEIDINSSVTGILPKYIVYGLLFVVLFKLFRRR